MSEVTIIGVDLANCVFQLHGTQADGSLPSRRNFRGRNYCHF